MADLPFPLPEPIASRLAAALDVEQKIPRALEALGPLSGRRVGLLDVGDGVHRARLAAAGIETEPVALIDEARIGADDATFDALVGMWSSFRGPGPGELQAQVAEADRVLRPGGRLLVVHDYGRDDVSTLKSGDLPEYTSWSRRDGPFLRGGLFRVRVLHCFWTFPTIEDAQAFLADAFGESGAALGAAMRRPRLTWNVAVFHRWQGGLDPAAAERTDMVERVAGPAR